MLDINICIVFILTIIAILFINVGHIYRDKVQLVMKHKLITVPSFNLDWWSLSHAVLFALYGFIIPNHHMTFTMLGALFELLEDALSSDATTQLADCTTKDKKNKVMCKFSINTDYWYAKWDDIIMNFIGYSIGSAIRTTIAPLIFI